MALHNIQVLDDKISDTLRNDVWEYLKDQSWSVYVRKTKEVFKFIPRQVGYDFPIKLEHSIYGVKMPRALLAQDADSLKSNHPLIDELWNEINAALGNEYTITGTPEGASGSSIGWRVYVNAQPKEWIKRSHGVHRDTTDLTDETTATILYIVNPIWYPTWFAENIFYSEDPEGLTGDHQQFQKMYPLWQSRDFKVGWPEMIVSPKPGRLIIYDGRSLHTTRPASEWCPNDVMRLAVAFRVRKKISL